jgi:3-deoxy-D-manno-octulosonate 8-phosphate phosphatase (KDO 8-P phosphatase)
MTAELTERAGKIRMVLMDVDGVLTDGKFYFLPGPKGEMIEVKAFDSQDGIALQWLHAQGIAAGLISGRVSVSTTVRAEQAHFRYVYQGHPEKIPILQEIVSDSGLNATQIAYIGDDLTDIVVMNRVGLAIATANAAPEVKRAVHYVTTARGGHGAVREAVELILKAQGLWGEILRKYEVPSACADRG